MSPQQIAYLVLYEGIGPTAEGGHLHKVEVVGLLCCPLCGLDDSVHVGPLLHRVGLSGIHGIVAPDDVVADHVHA